MIRDVSKEDAGMLCSIYNHYVLHSIATFDLHPLSAGDMQQRIESICRDFPWLVFEQEGEILGYAHASRWKSRPAYHCTAEVTVYTAPGKGGQGIGERLYRHLITEMAGRGFHSLLAGIALPNPASIALHEKLGFEKAAHLKEVGWKSGRWIDVGYWELLLSPQAPGEDIV